MGKMIPVQQWNSCRLDRCGPVYILTLTGDGQHRLNPSFIDEILTALTTVEQSPEARALITTNEGRYFCNGLDLEWHMKNKHLLPAADIIRDKLEGLLSSLMKLAIPTISAICGHTVAGGVMLALACDYRFMINGRTILYMAELDHGLMVPRSLMSLVRSKLSPAAVREVALKARKFTASEAFEFGVIDGFYDGSANKTLEAAIAHAEKLASMNWNRESYANTRARTFPGVIERLEAHEDTYRWGNGAGE